MVSYKIITGRVIKKPTLDLPVKTGGPESEIKFGITNSMAMGVRANEKQNGEGAIEITIIT